MQAVAAPERPFAAKPLSLTFRAETMASSESANSPLRAIRTSAMASSNNGAKAG